MGFPVSVWDNNCQFVFTLYILCLTSRQDVHIVNPAVGSGFDLKTLNLLCKQLILMFLLLHKGCELEKIRFTDHLL